MPLYEYVCQDCRCKFEKLRRMAEADAAIACPDCGAVKSKRAISLFAARSSDGPVAGSGSSCGSCSGGSCGSCGNHSH